METEQWNEIIKDLWECLPHFQDEIYLYDEHCIQFDCVVLEESDSDSETWPHQNTSDIEDEHEEIEDIKDENKMAKTEDVHEEVDEKDKSKVAML